MGYLRQISVKVGICPVNRQADPASRTVLRGDALQPSGTGAEALSCGFLNHSLDLADAEALRRSGVRRDLLRVPGIVVDQQPASVAVYDYDLVWWMSAD